MYLDANNGADSQWGAAFLCLSSAQKRLSCFILTAKLLWHNTLWCVPSTCVCVDGSDAFLTVSLTKVTYRMKAKGFIWKHVNMTAGIQLRHWLIDWQALLEPRVLHTVLQWRKVYGLVFSYRFVLFPSREVSLCGNWKLGIPQGSVPEPLLFSMWNGLISLKPIL